MSFLLRISATYWRILAIICIASVWAVSLWPSMGTPFRFQHADKVSHFIAYATIAFLLSRGWPGMAAIAVWIIALFCGGAAEIGQALFTTTRHPEWLDMLANAGGAFAGVMVARLTMVRAPSAP
ncbi:MAG: VanZ family protein [Gammaproteobacteria bacterium]|nr:VanZ family protein [Gammaproteobacteria bacterium]MBQ0774235.1 VanZ family protein [Gammaproteobacteria bacterium]